MGVGRHAPGLHPRPAYLGSQPLTALCCNLGGWSSADPSVGYRNQIDVNSRLRGEWPGNTGSDAHLCGSLCHALLPTEAAVAKPRSLSKVYAVGQFPFDKDTARFG